MFSVSNFQNLEIKSIYKYADGFDLSGIIKIKILQVPANVNPSN